MICIKKLLGANHVAQNSKKSKSNGLKTIILAF